MSWRAFAAILRKDLRLQVRDRQQVLGLVSSGFAILLMVFVFNAEPMVEARERFEEIQKEHATEHGVPIARPSNWQVRWSIVGVGAFLSFIVAIVSVTLAISTFVGERESGTAEVLFSTPLSDRALYLMKVASASVVGFIPAYFVVGICGAYALWELFPLPTWLPVHDVVIGVLAALPVPALTVLCLIGVGTICSVRAETVQGAGTLFGGIMILGTTLYFGATIFFGVEEMTAGFLAVKEWMEHMGFAARLGLYYGLYVAFAGVTLGVGYGLFQREKLLT
jgi:ABC-type Na+ efflux pump permease subunit